MIPTVVASRKGTSIIPCEHFYVSEWSKICNKYNDRTFRYCKFMNLYVDAGIRSSVFDMHSLWVLAGTAFLALM